MPRTAKQGTADVTGGASRDRTDDLLLAKQALSQLSYGPLISASIAGARIRELGFDVFRSRQPMQSIGGSARAG